MNYNSEDEDGALPNDEHYDRAFVSLLERADLGRQFAAECHIEFMRPYVLYHTLGGLPLRNKTESDDDELDSWQGHMERFLSGYRVWLDKRGTLTSEATRIMQLDIEAAKQESMEHDNWQDMMGQ